MKKFSIILSIVLFLVGAGLFLTAFISVDFDITKLSTGERIIQTQAFEENFSNIRISADTPDISFVISENETPRVDSQTMSTSKYSVYVKNDTLYITEKESFSWFDLVRFNFGKSSITVYISKSVYNSIIIETDTGDISLKDITAESISLESDTGNIKLANTKVNKNIILENNTGNTTLTSVECTVLSGESDTGNITFTDVIASGKINLESDTGNIKLNDCDGGSLEIESDTGNVTGVLLTEKTFVAKSDTGNVKVPKETTGGRCYIETDTGNIKFTIK
ncbi:MAG: DUF4097 family beta strand repeat protein [Clostridia bacterium]|nr:DUF4097 family beta strand repeat protein [Clostridia bacterium]